MKKVQLVAYDIHERKLTPQNCADLQYMTDTSGYFIVSDVSDSKCVLTTLKGEYTLDKHCTLNYYHGVCDGIKVHVCLKKMVGSIIYWPK